MWQTPHRMTIAALARRCRLLLAEMRLERLLQRGVVDTLLPRRGPQSNVLNSAKVALVAADPVVWPGCVYAWLCTWQEWRGSRVAGARGPPARIGESAHPGQRVSAKDPLTAGHRPDFTPDRDGW